MGYCYTGGKILSIEPESMEPIKLDRKTRYVIFGTLGAFLLSILVGLFSNNPFVIVLIRAVVSSLIFGLMLFGVLQLIKRYIPEILTPQKEENTPGVVHERTGGSQEFSTVGMNKIEKDGKNTPDTEFSPVPGIQEDGSQFLSDEADVDQAESDELPSLDNLFDEEEILPDDRIGEETENSSAPKEDHIDVGDMKFPNDPETLAKVVKRVMSQD